MRRPTLAAATALGLTVALASCGVPTDEGTFSEIPPEEVPFRLGEIATTTTSTTTTTTTTTEPPQQPVTTVERTTTTVAPTELVEIYFLSRDDLLPVVMDFPSPYSRNELISQLEAGPPAGPAAQVGLDTLIEPGLIVDTTEGQGVVTVFFDKTVYEEIDSRDQISAIGQIVLTFTSNLRGVGQVAFMLDDEPLRVRKADGLLADEGEAVSRDDYRELIAGETESTATVPDDDTEVEEPAGTGPTTTLPQ